MLSREDFEKIVNSVKEKIDETTFANISEEMLSIMSAYANATDEYNNIVADRDKLKLEKDDLLKVNGKLYQKIGFDEPKEEKEEKNDEVDELKVEDIINEKGEII